MNFKKRLTTIVLAIAIMNNLTSCYAKNSNSSKEVLYTTMTEEYDNNEVTTTIEEDKSSIDATKKTESTTSSTTITTIKEEITQATTSRCEEISTSLYDGLLLSEEDLNVLATTFKVSDFSNLNNIINSIEVYYPYEELYTQEYSLNIATSNSTNINIIKNNKVDYTALYNQVIQNNKEYLENTSNKNYTDNDSLVSVACEIICNELNTLINEDVDLDLLNENLANLKIFIYSSFGNGYYNQETGVLGLNKNILEDDELKDVIAHEAIHILTSASVSELTNSTYESRIGFTYENSSTEIDAYNWTWYVEASAESLAYKYSNLDSPLVYNSQIKTLELIKLSTFDTNDNLEKLLFSDDINVLYDYFNCSSTTDKEEINKMFYAFTILYNNMPGYEGNNFYKTLKSVDESAVDTTTYMSTEKVLEGNSCLILSKQFYKNLGSKIQNKNINLEDLFSVISVYELEISRELWYQSKYADLEDFLVGYTTIQDAFFEEIANSLDISLDYIKELYYMYNNQVEISNINISWLTEDENEYFNYINETRVGNKKDAILKVYSDNYLQSLTR